jgi:hypothetical protein
VRYRFHLTLPSRHGERQLVAEDARLLAFEGAPKDAVWLPVDAALALTKAEATRNTDPHFGENTINRILGQLPETEAHLAEYGEQLAADLDESHRRVRRASREIVQGLKITVQQPADLLGVYVYLPVTPGGTA